MPTTSNRVAPYGTTIFAEINQLAAQHNAINLGQGRPDFDGPPDIIAAAVTALQDGRFNQYPPMPGSVNMRAAIARHAGAFYNLDVDPNGGVIITAGATEAIFASILGLVDPGDEVIVIEPFFDSYVPNITYAGARPVYVPLRPPGWTLDLSELRAAFTPRTRALIWNSPQNPTGRVFTLEETMRVADLCKEFDVTVISDEVYEHLTFGDTRHIPMASLPGMFERTVTVSSLGKSYSVTGWKIGWVYGPNHLISGAQRAHQFISYAVMGPAQEAGAYALSQPGAYYEELQAMYSGKRDILMDGLKAAGFKFMVPEGTYFIMADFSDLYAGDAVSFARHLTTEIGVGCIPPSPFYSEANRHIGETWARFAFCKGDDTLHAANERLLKLKIRK